MSIPDIDGICNGDSDVRSLGANGCSIPAAEARVLEVRKRACNSLVKSQERCQMSIIQISLFIEGVVTNWSRTCFI
jgi:hypothetical protein